MPAIRPTPRSAAKPNAKSNAKSKAKSNAKAAGKSTRTELENVERAYIAASRRQDRSLEARVESARRASAVHFERTGKYLHVTEEAVLNEEMYEEVDLFHERFLERHRAQDLESVQWRMQQDLALRFGLMSQGRGDMAMLTPTMPFMNLPPPNTTAQNGNIVATQTCNPVAPTPDQIQQLRMTGVHTQLREHPYSRPNRSSLSQQTNNGSMQGRLQGQFATTDTMRVMTSTSAGPSPAQSMSPMVSGNEMSRSPSLPSAPNTDAERRIQAQPFLGVLGNNFFPAAISQPPPQHSSQPTQRQPRIMAPAFDLTHSPQQAHGMLQQGSFTPNLHSMEGQIYPQWTQGHSQNINRNVYNAQSNPLSPNLLRPEHQGMIHGMMNRPVSQSAQTKGANDQMPTLNFDPSSMQNYPLASDLSADSPGVLDVSSSIVATAESNPSVFLGDTPVGNDSSATTTPMPWSPVSGQHTELLTTPDSAAPDLSPFANDQWNANLEYPQAGLGWDDPMMPNNQYDAQDDYLGAMFDFSEWPQTERGPSNF